MKKEESLKCVRAKVDTEQIDRCKEQLKSATDSIGLLSKALSLAGNEVRLKILFLLYKEKRLCVCDMSDILGMTVPAVSQHLRKMRDREVVITERQSQTIYYSLTKSYKTLFAPFFEQILEDKLLEVLSV